MTIYSHGMWGLRESECMALSRKLLEGKDSHDFIRTRLKFTVRHVENTVFAGSMFEIFLEMPERIK